MARPNPSAASTLTCTQLVTRFDRNGEREIGIALLRQMRLHIGREMRESGAKGSMVWRLTRTPSGITMTAFWHAKRERMIESALPIRFERQQRRQRAAAAGIENRRRVGRLTVPHVRAVGAFS